MFITCETCSFHYIFVVLSFAQNHRLCDQRTVYGRSMYRLRGFDAIDLVELTLAFLHIPRHLSFSLLSHGDDNTARVKLSALLETIRNIKLSLIDLSYLKKKTRKNNSRWKDCKCYDKLYPKLWSCFGILTLIFLININQSKIHDSYIQLFKNLINLNRER